MENGLSLSTHSFLQTASFRICDIPKKAHYIKKIRLSRRIRTNDINPFTQFHFDFLEISPIFKSYPRNKHKQSFDNSVWVRSMTFTVFLYECFIEQYYPDVIYYKIAFSKSCLVRYYEDFPCKPQKMATIPNDFQNQHNSKRSGLIDRRDVDFDNLSAQPVGRSCKAKRRSFYQPELMLLPGSMLSPRFDLIK